MAASAMASSWSADLGLDVEWKMELLELSECDEPRTATMSSTLEATRSGSWNSDVVRAFFAFGFALALFGVALARARLFGANLIFAHGSCWQRNMESAHKHVIKDICARRDYPKHKQVARRACHVNGDPTSATHMSMWSHERSLFLLAPAGRGADGVRTAASSNYVKGYVGAYGSGSHNYNTLHTTS